MSYTGMALMGTGIASGEDRAVTAAREAISSPLLENCSIEGARGVLINITGPSSLTLIEMSAACEIIENTAHEDALIIIGRVLDDTMGEEIKITVIATGFEDEVSAANTPKEVVRQPLDFPETFRVKEDLFFQNETETATETKEDLDWLDAPTFLRNRKAQ